jgi:hypothetical protein
LDWFIKTTVAGVVVSTTTTTSSPQVAWGAAAVQDSLNVDEFIRTGYDGGGNMGVSSQAGKTKPVTGVYLR